MHKSTITIEVETDDQKIPADTYGRATRYADQVEEMKTFAKGFYEKFREKQLKENKA